MRREKLRDRFRRRKPVRDIVRAAHMARVDGGTAHAVCDGESSAVTKKFCGVCKQTLGGGKMRQCVVKHDAVERTGDRQRLCVGAKQRHARVGKFFDRLPRHFERQIDADDRSCVSL